MKSIQVGLQSSALASQLRKRKMRNIKIGTCGALFNKKIDNRNEKDEQSKTKNGMFTFLKETNPIHVIDAVASWVFIIAFGLFNYIYWSTIVEKI